MNYNLARLNTKKKIMRKRINQLYIFIIY